MAASFDHLPQKWLAADNLGERAACASRDPAALAAANAIMLPHALPNGIDAERPEAQAQIVYQTVGVEAADFHSRPDLDTVLIVREVCFGAILLKN